MFSSVGVGGDLVSQFDNVNPLTPVLPNLYVTVIGWEETQAPKKFILNIWRVATYPKLLSPSFSIKVSLPGVCNVFMSHKGLC